MYSKAMAKQTGAYRIPDNYRGHAFDTAESHDPPLSADLTPPESPLPEAPSDAPVPVSAENHSLLSSLLPPKPTGMGGLLQKFGTEELLILGIVLLLSGSDSDDDILLLLLLLLFYK